MYLIRGYLLPRKHKKLLQRDNNNKKPDYKMDKEFGRYFSKEYLQRAAGNLAQYQ